MARSVRVRRPGKPVVASMGGVAASGGYYVSMAADVIVANPGTITGSIGVMTGKGVPRDLKDKRGRPGAASPRAATRGCSRPSRSSPTTSGGNWREILDRIYADFVGKAAQDRRLDFDDVEQVARGRVWTGADASAHGLVDELGGLRTAVDRAKVLAGFDADTEVKVVGCPARR